MKKIFVLALAFFAFSFSSFGSEPLPINVNRPTIISYKFVADVNEMDWKELTKKALDNSDYGFQDVRFIFEDESGQIERLALSFADKDGQKLWKAEHESNGEVNLVAHGISPKPEVKHLVDENGEVLHEVIWEPKEL